MTETASISKSLIGRLGHEKKTHELKCWPQFFEAIAQGHKRHDLRRCDDRDFRVGDGLLLREFDPNANAYTGREQVVVITYITSTQEPCALSSAALDPDFCILSIAPAQRD
jgi:uncharacterized protein DUF3850